jgi:FkbM family methyltransferase
MIPELLKQHNIKVTGVCVLGAHWFQERDMWLSVGIKDFVLIEPVTDTYRIMQDNVVNIPGIITYNVAVGEKREGLMMNLDTTNQRQSSSLLTPKLHLVNFPRVKFTQKQRVEVWPLDELKFKRENYNFLFMDTQGYELPIFKGATKTLKTIDAIYTEVSFAELYEGCALLDDVDKYLLQFGFKRVFLGDDRGDYSDALYKKMV